MKTDFCNKFFYKNCVLSFNSEDAAHYNLEIEHKIYNGWYLERTKQIFLRIITLGFAYFFQKKTTSMKDLKERILIYRSISLQMHEAARKIQFAAARHFYKKHQEVRSELEPYLSSKNFGGVYQQGISLLKVWWQEGSVDPFTGVRGQIIWKRAKELGDKLKAKGFYVFYHAHSFPIALHLDLSSFLRSMHQSQDFQNLKPLESRRTFRAPGVARYFKNTSEYLRSTLGQEINAGRLMDDHVRETIISCDAIPDNHEAYESCQHFFKSNKSIVETTSSTGMKHHRFDEQFIKSYIKDPHLQRYAVHLLSQTRFKLKNLSSYGMIRVIAIAKETLEDPRRNYVWRSHAFGRLCQCHHTKDRYGHEEFVATLRKHQKGQYERCRPALLLGSFPQYRILAANLDKDPTKQIYTMDCLEPQEIQAYQCCFDDLKDSLIKLIRLEKLGECKTDDEVLLALKGIDHHESSFDYYYGIRNVLNAQRKLVHTYLPGLLSEYI